MRDIKRIKEVVRGALADDFDNIKIIDIQVREDTDANDDDILRVFVIFEGTPKDEDVEKLSGAVRRVRPELRSKLDESAFPLFSFISKVDAGDRNFEAA
ncbi:MAG: hypothetical protein HC871_05305 [Rhizobiales bacterium]|nr:hypothetical protein [Hyphomicrobiales bacterium]